MNGGGPLVAPLRALRHAPMLVDDVGVVPVLGRAAGDSALGPFADVEELVRWTRAWLVVWQGALHSRGVIGSVPPWTASVPLDELPTLKGDPDRRRRSAALALLEHAGLLTAAEDGRSVRLAESVFVSHRAGLEIDWGTLTRTLRCEPAPLLTVRALAELIVPPEDPTPVTLRELAERTGYAPKQVRVALRRLADAGVVRVSEASGVATRYCFDSAARLAGQIVTSDVRMTTPDREAAPPASAPTPAARAAAVPRMGPLPSPAVAPAPRVAVRMTLNGVTLTLGAGLTPHVELDPDGVPHISFDADPR